MSDARMEAARQKMDAGDLQEAMALLKGLLAERPDDGEVRQTLMELQELMMLDLQIQERLRRARTLAQQGDAAGAQKVVDEILKVNPRHREALALSAELGSAPPPADGEFDFGELPPPPAPAGGASAPAGGEFDFGELPAAFPDAPAAAPAAPAGEQAEFDFGSVPPLPTDFGLPAPAPAHESTATSGGGASSLSPQEQAKVAQYIAEGKTLLSQGRTQDAIDVWTRVFILDEENHEAQSLIDQARATLSAGQGELEYALNEGIAAFNAGDFPRAKPLLEKVLLASPGHREAQYYLSRMPAEAPAAPDFELDADFGTPAPAPPPPPARPAAPAPAPAPAPADLDGFELETGAAEDFVAPAAAAAPAAPLSAAPAPVPMAAPSAPAPRSVAAGPRPAPVSKKGGTPRLGLIFGGLGLLAVVGLGLVFLPKLLGGGAPPPPPKTAPAKPLAPKTPVAEPVQPAAPAAPAEPQGKEALFQAAKEAMAAKDYQKAIEYYRKVLTLDALNPEAQTGLESARAAYQVQIEEEARNARFLKDYQNSVRSYRDGDYAESLRLAWRLIYPDDTLARQLGKANSVHLLLRNGYYNWAVRDLKSENPRGAEKNLKDLLDAEKSDAEAKKLLDFTRKYIGRPIDAGYRDTVSALTYRPFEEVP